MTAIALIDANAFYASCEISFQPKLANRPVVVLSNNDGCVVAANQIAKDLEPKINYGSGGYKSAKPTSMMFQPYFKVANFLKQHNTAVFSSNYELYADMSNRMHKMLGTYSPRQEIYSIDESFLDFTGLQKNLTEYSQKIRKEILQGLGLPVGIGIGKTKTLAKIANHIAKKHSHLNGVFNFNELDDDTHNAWLKKIKVGDIWGVGKQLSQGLNQLHIYTAYDLKSASPKRLRARFGVVMERIWSELNGYPALELNEVREANKQIIRSRSFGKPVTNYDYLAEAVSTYAARAAENLRSQKLFCQYITVGVQTSRYHKYQSYYSNNHSFALVYPTDNTLLLTKMAKRALKRIYRPNLEYSKASVMLSDLTATNEIQLDIFAPNPRYSDNSKSDALMDTMDKINKTFGKNSIQLASQGLASRSEWEMQRNFTSQRYTTRFDELLVVR